MRRTVFGVVLLGLMLAGRAREHRGLVPEAKQLDTFANADDVNGFVNLVGRCGLQGRERDRAYREKLLRAALSTTFQDFRVDSYDYRSSGDTVKWKPGFAGAWSAKWTRPGEDEHVRGLFGR